MYIKIKNSQIYAIGLIAKVHIHIMSINLFVAYTDGLELCGAPVIKTS